MGQPRFTVAVCALHDRTGHGKWTKAGNGRRKSQTLLPFPTKSARRTFIGDFHSVSPGIAAGWRRFLATPLFPPARERHRQGTGIEVC
jgi:hypothetical protein